MKLVALPAFTDNYIWMLHDTRHALVVDPGQAQPVLDALQGKSLQLDAILVTHHHGDHVGGVEALRQATDATVYGPARENIPQPCVPLSEGQAVQTLGLRFEVLDIPGHTAGHIAYYCAQPAPGMAPLLFCGDTLFSGGCGRVFEGTPAQMHASLHKLACLPAATQVCCAHEYTLSNLRFAQTIEPDNAALIAYVAACQTKRATLQPTLPARLELELQINPFLRCDVARVMAAAQSFDPTAQDPVTCFAALRQWKNQF